MTRPIVMDVIARDNASKTFKAVAASQSQLARQTEGLSKSDDNLRKAQLTLIASQERYNKVARDSGASVGKLASAQSSLISAQQRVRKATDDTAKSTEQAATKNKAHFSGMATAAAVAGVAAVGLAKSFVTAADDQRKANAQTAAVIKSTGGAAHVTAAHISDLTGSLSKLNGIQDDNIQSGSNMLLTFTNIRNETGKGNDVFDQATKAVTDMSVALGKDMPAAALIVGKALNDPIKGMTALSKAGVQFTEQQKTQIKTLVQTGNVMGAQKLILAELNKEFGGSAAAQATAAGKMSAAWDNFKEAAGNALLPILDKVFTALSGLLDVFSQYSDVLVPAALAVGGFGIAVWLVNKATDAWAASTKALTTVIGPQLTASLKGATAGLVGTLGPLGLIVAGTYAVAQATGGLRGYINNLASSGDNYTKSVTKTADALKTNLTTALRQSTVDHVGLVNEVIAAGKALGGVSATVFSSGTTWKQLGGAVTGTDKQFADYIETVKQHMKAGGADNGLIKDSVGELFKLRDSYTGAASSAKDFVGAVGSSADGLSVQEQALNKVREATGNQALTLGGAKKMWDDAHTAAYSLTAQIGYMSAALAENGGNAITSRLQQLALTDAIGTEGDKFAATRAQVDAHGKSLKDNTADGRNNIAWALQQIQAIDQQAVSFATATGDIHGASVTLGHNTDALRNSMYQAGFTKGEVDKLIKSYSLTPKKLETIIAEKGSQAVVTALGGILDMLHRIADPVWAANVDVLSRNTSMPLGGVAAPGRASGGLMRGPGSGTSDSIVARLSDGEYVVNAAATARHLPMLENINRNKYAAGGLVGALNVDVQKGAWLDVAAFAQHVKNLITPPAPPGGVAAPGNISALQAYAASLFGSFGWGQGELGSLIALWNGESGWNPGATNPSSGAYGIPQSLPAEKMASAGADWRTNGATQIRWGLDYIKSVYGSPSATYGAWLSRSPHWYGQGSWDVPRTELAGVHRGEMIIPAAAAEGIRSGAGGGDARSIARAVEAGLSGMEIRFDGDGLARLVSVRQSARALKGPRR